uniref:Uncharacterized protein n=1 Tax=Octopus bimaculoides TaxID=37653 RepID=A0A0L8G3S3_OCTBM
MLYCTVRVLHITQNKRHYVNYPQTKQKRYRRRKTQCNDCIHVSAIYACLMMS